MIVSPFIVQASFTIVTYDRQNMFIIQATDVNVVTISLSLLLGQNKLKCLSLEIFSGLANVWE